MRGKGGVGERRDVFIIGMASAICRSWMLRLARRPVREMKRRLQTEI